MIYGVGKTIFSDQELEVNARAELLIYISDNKRRNKIKNKLICNVEWFIKIKPLIFFMVFTISLSPDIFYLVPIGLFAIKFKSFDPV